MTLFARLIEFPTLYLALFTELILGHPMTSAAEEAEEKDLVEKSRMTLDSFLADPNMGWFRDHITDAKGIFIEPQLLKAAFFFGGEGGSGVFLVKDDKTGEWSEPAFYTMGAGSFGFQFGAQASEIVLLVMSQRGVESLLRSTFKLGGDISVAPSVRSAPESRMPPRWTSAPTCSRSPGRKASSAAYRWKAPSSPPGTNVIGITMAKTSGRPIFS
jgi:hypothetical protein